MNTSLNAIFFNNFDAAHIPEIYEEIYLKKIYDPYISGKKDLLIVDIGANIGLTAYYFKDHAKEIFAVEPSKLHQEILQNMLDYNKIDNVTICKYAISNKNGKEKFYINETNSTASSLTLVNKEENFEEVETVTFDEFMVRNKLDHLDILKLDPEGEEGKIITSKGFKEYADKISVVLGEWHPWCNMERLQFMNTFKDLGFDFKWLFNTKAACYVAERI